LQFIDVIIVDFKKKIVAPVNFPTHSTSPEVCITVTKREGRELERELCRNTETTRHGERIDPNRI
jgi:hypothetical protein